jgi:hypothetical protein
LTEREISARNELMSDAETRSLQFRYLENNMKNVKRKLSNASYSEIQNIKDLTPGVRNLIKPKKTSSEI